MTEAASLATYCIPHLAGLPVGIVMCSRVNTETDKNRKERKQLLHPAT